MYIRKIVIEEDSWHPLDHHIGSARCRSFQGGDIKAALRLHWEYWNDFKKETDLAWWYKLTRCYWGRHQYRTWYKTNRDGPQEIHSISCRWCMKEQHGFPDNPGQ